MNFSGFFRVFFGNTAEKKPFASKNEKSCKKTASPLQSFVECDIMG